MTAARCRAAPEVHEGTPRESIERAIEYIWERYSEPVSLDELSKSALLSRFHFARTFRDITGVTPGRFLSAVRIHQAKRLLVNTTRTITDISSAVGYQSLGSFTNYFTQSVGMPPSQFRHLGEGTVLGLLPPENHVHASRGTAAVTISFPDGCSGLRAYVGFFPSAILQSPPVAAKVIDAAGDRPPRCVLPNVPPGTWFVHAVATAGLDRSPRQLLFVDRRDAVTVGPHTALSLSMRLRPIRPTDPPVLLALPDLRALPTPRPAAGRAG
ncbi:helix-turn-helix domain-containing protein [Streptomyces sp. NRRL S-340]|uniref:helix-turn-helix domain-containing protein n=1 Tax=Streptomyces sp. NRRL S-340 TaxID=1463901 RepID=UPI000B1AF4DD|nr:AraC family transcriptional regulator [Streptomyces sp. NRRL S-340]